MTKEDEAAAIQADYAPQIAAAVERDRVRRIETAEELALAFLDVPHLVCGVPLKAMTFPDYLALIAGKNAHVVETKIPTSDDESLRFWSAHDTQLAWIVSPDYVAHDSRARQMFVAKISRVPFVDFHQGIGAYLRETFLAAPRPARRADEAELPQADPVGVAFIAHWQHRIASAYGWSRAELRTTPLKELFQFIRLLQAEDQIRAGKSLQDPLDGEADLLWSEMLQKINALSHPSGGASS